MNKNFKNYTALMHVLLLTSSTCFASSASDDPDEVGPSRGNRSAPAVSSKKTKAKKVSKKREQAEPEVGAVEPPVTKKAAVGGHTWNVLDHNKLKSQLNSRNGSRINTSRDTEATSCCFAFLNWVKTGQLAAATNEEISVHNDENVVPGASVITIGDQRYDYQNPAAQKEITFKPSSTFLSEEEVVETKAFKLELKEKQQIEKIFNSIPLKDGEGGQYAVGLICMQFKDGAEKEIEIKKGKISGDVFNFYIYKKPGDDKPVVLIIDPTTGAVYKLATFISGKYHYKANFHIWFDESQEPEQLVEQEEPIDPDFQLDSHDFFRFEGEAPVMPAKKRQLQPDNDVELFEPVEANKRGKSDEAHSNSDSIDARTLYSLIQDNTEKAIKGDKDALAWLIDAVTKHATADAHYGLGLYYYHEFISSYDPKRFIKTGAKVFSEAKKYLTLAVKQNHRDAAIKLARLYFHNNMDTAAFKVLKESVDEELQLAHLDLLADGCLRSIHRLNDESGLNSALNKPERIVKVIKQHHKEAKDLCAKLQKTQQIPDEISNKLSLVESFFNKEDHEEESQVTRQSAPNQDSRPFRKRPSSTEVVVPEDSVEVVEEMPQQDLSRLIQQRREIAENDPEHRAEILVWLSKLAEEGSNEAQLALAIFYNSIAVKESNNEKVSDEDINKLNTTARTWLEFSASNGNKKAINILTKIREGEKQPLPQAVSNSSPKPAAVVEKRAPAVEPKKSSANNAIREKQPLPKPAAVVEARAPAVEPKKSSANSVIREKQQKPQEVSNSSPKPAALVEKRAPAVGPKKSPASSAIREKQPLPQQAQIVRAAPPKEKEINLISDESPEVVKAVVQINDPRVCLEQAKKLLSKNKHQDGLELLQRIIKEYADKNGEYTPLDRKHIKKQAATLYIESQIARVQAAVNDENLLSSVDLLESIASGELIEATDPSNQLELGHFKQIAKKALSGLCVSKLYLNKVEGLLKSNQPDLGVAMLKRAVEYKSMQATLRLSDYCLSQGQDGHNKAFETLMEAYQGSAIETEKQQLLDKILNNTAAFQSRILALTPALHEAHFCLKIGEKLLSSAETREAAFVFLSAAADKGSVPAFMCMVKHHKKAGKASFDTVFNLIQGAYSNMGRFDSKVFCPEAQRVLEELGDGYANQPQNLEDFKEAIKCYEAAIKMAEHMNNQFGQTQVKNKLGKAHLNYAKMILNGPSTLQLAQSAVESLIRSKEYCFLTEANQLLHAHGMRVANNLFSSQDQALKDKAIEFAAHLANLANGDASYWLGRLYMEDQFGVKDLAKAKEFMAMAVAQKNPKAQAKLDDIESLILTDKFETAVLLAKSVNSMPDLEKSNALLRGLMDKKSKDFDQKVVCKYLGLVHDAIGQLKWNAGEDKRSAIFSFQEAIKLAGATRPDGSNRDVSLTERRIELGLIYLNQQPMTQESLNDAGLQFNYVKREFLSADQAETFKQHLSRLYYQQGLFCEKINKSEAIRYLKQAAAVGNMDAAAKLKELTGTKSPDYW